MWNKFAQHAIGATTSGKPINFHYQDDGYSSSDHHDAASFHDLKRNKAAQLASHYDQLGLKGAANGYRKLAAHHGAQATMHMDKVLPKKS